MSSVDLIRESASTWAFSYYVWTFLHYAVGLSAVSLAALAASKLVTDEWQPLVSLAAAVSVAVLTFLRPSEVAFGFDQASGRVRAALIEYDFRASAADMTPEGKAKAFADLYNAYVAARRLVSDVQPFKINASVQESGSGIGSQTTPVPAS